MNQFDGIQHNEPKKPSGHIPKGFGMWTQFLIVAITVAIVAGIFFSGSSIASLTYNVSLIFNSNLNIGLESYLTFDGITVGTSTLTARVGLSPSYGGGIGSTTAYTTFGTSTVIVPAGITQYTIKLWGAGGGLGGLSGIGGGGGFVQSDISVTPGETLKVEVGKGDTSTNNGGGASTVKRSSTYLGIAGGGGGGGGGFGLCLIGLGASAAGGYGGGGGGSSGLDGLSAIVYEFTSCVTPSNSADFGNGATSGAGGAGGSGNAGTDGIAGAANAGGNGGATGRCGSAATGCGGSGTASGGGGGGGGSYGGGGGENDAVTTAAGGGGGGGSSLTTGTNVIQFTSAAGSGAAANRDDIDHIGTAGDYAVANGLVVLKVANPFTSSPGRIGQALTFGINSYIDYGASSNLVKNVSAESVAFWVKMNATSSAISRYQTIVDISRGATDQTPRFEIQIATTTATTADIKLGLRAGDAETLQTATTTDASIKLGQWHHVVAISDFANDTATVYVDGVLQTLSGAVSFTAAATSNTSPLYAEIGREANTANSKEFVGALDDMRFYNRALSANDIQRLYHLGATTRISTSVQSNELLKNGLVSNWTFDGPTMFTKVTDSSGQANDGVLVSFTATTSVPGRLGQGLLFDGTDDYVRRPSAVVSDYPITISAWIKKDSLGTAGVIAGIFDSTQANWYAQYINVTAGNVVNAGSATNNVFAGANTSATITAGQWHHVVGVFTSATDRRIYLDGGNSVQDTTSNTPTGINNTVSGASGKATPDNFFKGVIDDVRFYSRALSASDVLSLYQVGATTQQNVSLRTNPNLDNSLSGYWTFDGLKVSGSTVTDTSGSSVTGTFNTKILDSNTSSNGTTTYSVPSSTTVIIVKSWGAGGGSAADVGGAGGYASATLGVTASESLTVEVGKGGTTPGGGSGGGASTVKRTSTYLLIASGGGGAGGGSGSCTQGVPPDEETYFWGGGRGGAGGGATSGEAGTVAYNEGCGGHAIGNAGGGAFAGVGGSAGTGGAGTDGTAGVSKAGGNGGATGTCGASATGCGGSGSASGYGGGGGGGDYGGGGGESSSAASGPGGGAGGGVSYVTGSNTTTTAGVSNSPGNSSDGERGSSGNVGTDGRVIIYAVKAATGTPAIGRVGQGLTFDGITTNVTFGASSNLVKNVGAATIAFWAKVDNFVTADVSTAAQYQTAVNVSRNTDATPRFEVQLVGTSTTAGVVKVAVRAGDAEALQSATTSVAVLKEGTWHHVVAVTDYANDTVTIYVDGSSQSLQAGTVSFTAAATSNTQPANAELGRDGATASKAFGGVLDDVRIYSRALTAAEVVRLYHLASSSVWNFPTGGFISSLFSYGFLLNPDMALLNERRRQLSFVSKNKNPVL